MVYAPQKVEIAEGEYKIIGHVGAKGGTWWNLIKEINLITEISFLSVIYFFF